MVLAHTYSFELDAETFHSIESKTTSPEFNVLGHTFNILVFPNGAKKPGWCSFYLAWCQSEYGLQPPSVRLSFSVTTCDGEVRKEARHAYSIYEIDWGWTDFLDVQAVEGVIRERQAVRFTVTFDVCSAGLDSPMQLQLQNATGSSSFFSDPTFSDCVVQLTDGTSIPAHRVVLSQHSSVLAALWTSGAQESQQRQMKLEAEPDVAKALLRLMYGLPVELQVRQLPELLALADMYDVSTLVTLIVDQLTAPQYSLDAAALAQTVLALLMILDSLPEQWQQRVQAHIKVVTEEAKDLSSEPYFLSHWSFDNVQAFLKASTGGTAAAAVKAAKMAHCWVQHDVEHRQQHWPQLLQEVDCNSMSKADMAVVSRDIHDHMLDSRMFRVLLERQAV